jgi:hypothetical protein
VSDRNGVGRINSVVGLMVSVNRNFLCTLLSPPWLRHSFFNLINFVFSFLYVVLYYGNHPLGFLESKEFHGQWTIHNHVIKNSSQSSL